MSMLDDSSIPPRIRPHTRLAVQFSIMTLLVLVPFVAMSIFSITYLRGHALSRARAGAAQDAQHLATVLEEHLQHASRMLQFLSRLPDIEQMEPEHARRILDLARQETPEFDSIVLAGTSGARVAESPTAYHPGEAFLWKSVGEAIRTRSQLVTLYWRSPATGKLALAFHTNVFGSGGAVVGILAASYDISNLERAYGAIDLPRGASVVVKDQNGTVCLASPAAARSNGGPRSFVATQPISLAANVVGFVTVRFPSDQLYREQDGVLVANILTSLVFGLSALAVALVYARRLLLRKLARLIAVAEQFALGDLSARTGLDYEVSELGQIAFTLERMADSIQSQRRFADTLLDNMEDGVVVCDVAGNVEYANSVFEQWCGAGGRFERLRGCSCKHPTGDEESKRLGAAGILKQICSGERVRDAEATLMGEARTERQVLCCGAPLYDGAGGRRGAIMVLKDITALKHATNELVETNTKLLQAQKMEAIGRLAGGVAHDFNNNLMVISGFSSLALAEPKLDAVLQGHLMEVKRAAERSAELTRHLLVFSRAQLMQPKAVDLNALVGSFQRLLGRLIGEDIRLELRLSPDVWHAMVDPMQIEQVMMNLATNARDAMPEGGTLTIETENVADVDARWRHELPPGDFVRLSVTDTGVGMTAATLARVFEPFFTTKPIGKGTGLGLPTVYGIVRQHGGHVSVRSEPGNGTTVAVLLPRATAAAADAPAPPSSTILTGSGRILVVEDDPNVSRLLVTIFEHAGYAVLRAANGDEALRLLDHGDVHLLLTDVIMSGMNGVELAKRARASRPELPIIIVSGYAEHEAIGQRAAVERVQFLSKPIDSVTLLQAVRSCLSARPVAEVKRSP